MEIHTYSIDHMNKDDENTHIKKKKNVDVENMQREKEQGGRENEVKAVADV